MKKWFIGIITFFLLFLISSYFIIPAKILVTKSIPANANQAGVYRFLNDESNWQKWWPGTASISKGGDAVLESGGFRFKRGNQLYNAFDIAITKDGKTDSSILHIFSLGKDSIKIEWNTTINTGTNPFNKIIQYFKAKKLNSSLEHVLTSLQKHISAVKNIYGIDIRKEKVMVEFLVTTKKTFDHYPTTGDVYELVGQMKKYITREQAKEEDFPMLNINSADSIHYEAQVAIPVDRNLTDTDTFSIKRMLKMGDILVAEITGGKNQIDSAMKQMHIYTLDYEYNNIAIPFHSLVTDRMKEADSTKWVTKIYYPVM